MHVANIAGKLLLSRLIGVHECAEEFNCNGYLWKGGNYGIPSAAIDSCVIATGGPRSCDTSGSLDDIRSAGGGTTPCGKMSAWTHSIFDGKVNLNPVVLYDSEARIAVDFIC